jgi:hypothetical protein
MLSRVICSSDHAAKSGRRLLARCHHDRLFSLHDVAGILNMQVSKAR